MIPYIVSGGLIAAAFATDVTKQKIPNVLTAAGFLAGILLHLFLEGGSGIGYALLGAALGFVPLLVLYWIRAVGAGDVKLFAALGSLAGAEFVLQSIMYSLVYAAAISCFILLWRWEWKERGKAIIRTLVQFFLWKDMRQIGAFTRSARHLRFPFMWAVLPAAATAFMQLY